MPKRSRGAPPGFEKESQFLGSNPFLELVPARVKKALDRLGSVIWSEMESRVTILAAEAAPDYVEFRAAKKLPREEIRSFPGHYGKLWDQRWFQLKFAPVNSGTWLRWNDQAEATLYVDGVPYGGFDVAHREILLPERTREVWIESIVCQTGIWHKDATGLTAQGSRLDGAVLLRRDETAWQTYHDLQVLDDLLGNLLAEAFPGKVEKFFGVGLKPPIASVPPLLRKLLRFLDRAVDALDRRGPEGAAEVMHGAYDSLRADGISPAAILTGHAHIDLVWLWPERVGERKAVHTFASTLRLMEQYPEFRFAYSQPASYEAVGKISPFLASEVAARCLSGQWEAQGACYVESDTLLACGEALLRSFLIGQQGFCELNGKPSPVLWLPDVFGYSGCLPQLMQETGVRYFFTTKLSWNAFNAFPHSSFRWVGIDGTEVLAHICQESGYNQAVSVAELRRGAEAHRQSDIHGEFLAPVGFGDGGGGVTAAMCERARRLGDLAGVPRAKWGGIGEFFGTLEDLRPDLPEYRGELYFEYHRGTYTTHGDIKKLFRRAEVALQILEAAACAGFPARVDVMDWKRVVFAQFHDYIPGSSIHEVYDQARKELAENFLRAVEGTSKALQCKESGTACLFNPLPQSRIHLAENGTLLKLPPLAGVAIESAEVVDGLPVRASSRKISNGRVEASFDKSGRISAMKLTAGRCRLRRRQTRWWCFPTFPMRMMPGTSTGRHSRRGLPPQTGPRSRSGLRPTAGRKCVFPNPLDAAARWRFGTLCEREVRYWRSLTRSIGSRSVHLPRLCFRQIISAVTRDSERLLEVC